MPRITEIIKCQKCNIDVIAQSSSAKYCQPCSKIVLRDQQRSANKKSRSARLARQGIIGTTQTCSCGASYIKNAPTRKKCSSCSEAARLATRSRAEVNRGKIRRENTIDKYSNLDIKCSMCSNAVILSHHQTKEFCDRCSKLRTIIIRAYHKAKTRHDCSLTCDDAIDMLIKQGYKCAITKLVFTDSGLKMPSIDRIDSGVGYHKDNVHIVCKWVNLAKSTHSLDELEAVFDELKQPPKNAADTDSKSGDHPPASKEMEIERQSMNP